MSQEPPRRPALPCPVRDALMLGNVRLCGQTVEERDPERNEVENF
jgi:hypothetical protein